MRSSIPRPVMLTVSTVLLAGVALLSYVVFAEGADFHCPNEWFVLSELLLVGSLVASAWSLYIAFRASPSTWLLAASAAVAGAILWAIVLNNLVTPVDTEPDASPRSEQCDDG